MKQETLQNAARPGFAVRTTAVCRRCCGERRRVTPGIARGFRVEGRRVGGVAAGLAGGLAGGLPGEAPQKDRPISLRQLKHPTCPSTENSAQRTASGGGTRGTSQPSAEKTPR